MHVYNSFDRPVFWGGKIIKTGDLPCISVWNNWGNIPFGANWCKTHLMNCRATLTQLPGIISPLLQTDIHIIQSSITNNKYLLNCKSYDDKTYISACHGYGVLAAIL